MSREIRQMPEGYSSRPTEMAWGCSAGENKGWVPYPKEIPRRHPLLDTVGRTDDPCDRPLIEPPDFIPTPKYKPPREGYPHNMCNVEKYQSERADYADVPEGAAVVNVGKGTPMNLTVRVPAMHYGDTNIENPTLDDCCEETRKLDYIREKHDEVVNEMKASRPQCDKTEDEKKEEGKNKSLSCGPNLPPYPCRGVIKPPRADATLFPEPKIDIKGSFTTAQQSNANTKPINGWEFINANQTCELYPIDPNLPSRFNNPLWFKGYGSDKPVHPFYVTTTSDYGRFGPNPHTMPQKYYPRESKFTEVLRQTGMYRNRTLNTQNAKTIV